MTGFNDVVMNIWVTMYQIISLPVEQMNINRPETKLGSQPVPNCVADQE
jgi:hypothetical protein